MKNESASLPSTTTIKPRTNRLPNTRRPFGPRTRPSWWCPPSWFRRSSSSLTGNGRHNTKAGQILRFGLIDASMKKPDYDDPAVEERWCNEQRVNVTNYLSSQKVKHGRIGDWPAWHVAPYVSIWAIES